MRNLLESLRLHIVTMQTFGAEQWSIAGYNQPFSWLYWVLSGSPSITLSGNFCQMRRGVLYLAPSNVTADYACQDALHVEGCAFTASIFGGDDLFHRLAMPLELPVTAVRQMDGRIRRLSSLAAGSSPHDILAADSLLRGFLAQFIEHSDLRLLRSGAHLAECFSPVLEYIESNLDRPLPLPALARIMHWHPTHFAEKFADAMGASPRRYINQKRLEKAQHLLNMTDLPIKAIAAKTGFADPYYFSRMFSRLTGVAPSAYRTHKHRILISKPPSND